MNTSNSSGLAVLMYHGVVTRPLKVADWCFLEVGEFKRQMEFLKENTRVIPLSQAGVELDRDGGPCAVALTFDDGLRCMYEVAFPILKELELPATLFLSTDFVGTDRRIWFCEVNHALAATNLDSVMWRDKFYDLSNPACRAHANSQIQAELKKLTPMVLLHELEKLIIALHIEKLSSIPDDQFFGVLDESSMFKMVSSRLIELGAHTGSHSILSLLDDDESNQEIQRSIERTSELSGSPCKLFAYPNGRKADYTSESIKTLKRLGIEVAVTTNDGPNHRGQSLLELNRIGIGSDTDFTSFQKLLVPFALRSRILL